MAKLTRAHETLAFLTITFALAWPLLLWWADAQIVVGLAMCVPGLVGVVLAWLIRGEGPGAARLEPGRPAAWAVAFLAPLALVLLVVLVAKTTGPGGAIHDGDFRFWLPILGEVRGVPVFAAIGVFLLVLNGSYVVPALTEKLTAKRTPLMRNVLRLFAWAVPMFLAHIAGDVGEEVGWRGYLFRRWERQPRAAVVVSALGWSAFHLPWAVLTARNLGPVSAIRFLVCIALLAVPFGALYRWGRSVWPCAIAHAGFDMWQGTLLGSALSPGAPSYFHVPGGAFGWCGVAVFATVAAVTWPLATSPVSAVEPTVVSSPP